MKARHAIAATLAASAAILAAAQTPANQQVPQSTASAAVSGGEDSQNVNNIIASLNADPSLRGSKITVATEGGVITLTGATETPEQKDHAAQVATQVAGEGNVINAILDSQT